MIVLDTNVVIETMKPESDATVLTRLKGQAAETLYLTSVTVAELLLGIAALPDGKRKERLTGAANGLIELYEGRVLFFDTDGARRYSVLAAAARRDGRGLSTPGGYIAAIAAANGFAIATRDTNPFEASGLKVFNPWAA